MSHHGHTQDRWPETDPRPTGPLALLLSMVPRGRVGHRGSGGAAVIGATAGGILGGIIDDNASRGAIIGAVAGGTAGALIARQMNHQTESPDAYPLTAGVRRAEGMGRHRFRNRDRIRLA